MEDKTLKDLRHKLKLSQCEVAQKLGITQSHYSKIERGERKPSMNVIGDLYKVLGEEVLAILITKEG